MSRVAAGHLHREGLLSRLVTGREKGPGRWRKGGEVLPAATEGAMRRKVDVALRTVSFNDWLLFTQIWPGSV